MLYTFWTWLRTRTREAMLAGISDAVDTLTAGEAAEDLTAIADGLRARLKALAPPAAVVEANGAIDEEAVTAGGRRRKVTN